MKTEFSGKHAKGIKYKVSGIILYGISKYNTTYFTRRKV